MTSLRGKIFYSNRIQLKLGLLAAFLQVLSSTAVHVRILFETRPDPTHSSTIYGVSCVKNTTYPNVTLIHVSCFDSEEKSQCCHEAAALWSTLCKNHTLPGDEKSWQQTPSLCTNVDGPQFSMYCCDKIAAIPQSSVDLPIDSWYLYLQDPHFHPNVETKLISNTQIPQGYRAHPFIPSIVDPQYGDGTLCVTTSSHLSNDGGMHRRFTTELRIPINSDNSFPSSANHRVYQGHVLLLFPVHHGIFIDADDPFGGGGQNYPCLSPELGEDSNLCSPCSIQLPYKTIYASCGVEFSQNTNIPVHVESPSFESSQYVVKIRVSVFFETMYTMMCTTTDSSVFISFSLTMHSRYNEPGSTNARLWIPSPWVHSGSIQLWNPQEKTCVSATSLGHCQESWNQEMQVWEVSVGRREHYWLVMPVTLCVATLGTLWMIMEVYRVSLGSYTET